MGTAHLRQQRDARDHGPERGHRVAARLPGPMAPWLRRVAPGALLVAACDLAFPLHEEPPQITYACGPSLRCSVSNINVGCCVITNVSTGSPPSNYEYECVTDKQCAIDRGDPAD